MESLIEPELISHSIWSDLPSFISRLWEHSYNNRHRIEVVESPIKRWWSVGSEVLLYPQPYQLSTPVHSLPSLELPPWYSTEKQFPYQNYITMERVIISPPLLDHPMNQLRAPGRRTVPLMVRPPPVSNSSLLSKRRMRQLTTFEEFQTILFQSSTNTVRMILLQWIIDFFILLWRRWMQSTVIFDGFDGFDG